MRFIAIPMTKIHLPLVSGKCLLDWVSDDKNTQMIRILRFVQTSAQNIGGWELRLGTLFPGAQYSTGTAVHCWSSSNSPLDQDVKTLPEMGNSFRLTPPPSPPPPLSSALCACLWAAHYQASSFADDWTEWSHRRCWRYLSEDGEIPPNPWWIGKISNMFKCPNVNMCSLE